MVWTPTVSEEVVSEACPEALTATVARQSSPSRKATLPEVAGVLATVSVTVAVNVTGLPAVDGLPDVVTVVVVA